MTAVNELCIMQTIMLFTLPMNETYHFCWSYNTQNKYVLWISGISRLTAQYVKLRAINLAVARNQQYILVQRCTEHAHQVTVHNCRLPDWPTRYVYISHRRWNIAHRAVDHELMAGRLELFILWLCHCIFYPSGLPNFRYDITLETVSLGKHVTDWSETNWSAARHAMHIRCLCSKV